MTLKTTTACEGCGKALGNDMFWHCTRCHRGIWRGAFRHRCVQGFIAQHGHDVDLWREVNPGMPCPCHEWGVGELLWGTHGQTDPRKLIIPGRSL